MIGLSSGLEGCVGVVIRVQLVCNRNMSAMTKGWPWSASCAQQQTPLIIKIVHTLR